MRNTKKLPAATAGPQRVDEVAVARAGPTAVRARHTEQMIENVVEVMSTQRKQRARGRRSTVTTVPAASTAMRRFQ